MLGDTTAEAVDVQQRRLSGEISVTYPFRLNWQTAARYRRSLKYLSVVGQPVLADGGRVELTGLLTRRLDLAVSGGYVMAASAMHQTPQPLESTPLSRE